MTMKKFIAIAALASLIACGGKDKKAEEEPKKDEPLSQAKISAQLDDQFSKLLTEYYHVKDALVLSNDSLATTSAKRLAQSAEAIDVKQIKADSSVVLTAKDIKDNISAGAKDLASATGIEPKRRAFKDISDNMYQLFRAVKYDKQVIYYQHCPMAFNDEGADWLNSTADIKNPYFGKKMLTCGEVKDSIDYRGK